MKRLCIDSQSELDALIKASSLVLVNTYRGQWCPFCRRYLVALDKHLAPYREHLEVFGVSVDEPEENRRLQEKLKLGFELLQDTGLVFHHSYGVSTGKGHGKDAYLQPSVFLFAEGKVVYQWIQSPSLKNLGGAVSRVGVQTVVEQVRRHIKARA